MVLLRLTVPRTVVASCHALEKGSLATESLAAGSIEKFWKGKREGENLSIFKIRKGHPILCFERLRRSMVLLRLTVPRTVVASCHALEKGSLAVESLAAGSIEKFRKGERERRTSRFSKYAKDILILCFERLRRSMVLLRLTVLRTVVASCHALEKGSLAVESLAAGSIEKF